MTANSPADRLRPAVESYLRRLWRQGRSRVTDVELVNWVQAASERYLVEDTVLDALALVEERRVCEHRRPMVHLTPFAETAFTLVDELLDSALPRDHATTGTLEEQVSHALSGAQLPRALRLNAARTLEYLARARHGVPRDAACALANDLIAARLTAPAARLLADLTPVAGTGQDADALVRTILGLPA